MKFQLRGGFQLTLPEPTNFNNIKRLVTAVVPQVQGPVNSVDSSRLVDPSQSSVLYSQR